MVKISLLSFLFLFALSCSKHTLPTESSSQTQTQIGETPTELPSPTPASPTPTPTSSPVPTNSPSPTPTVTSTPASTSGSSDTSFGNLGNVRFPYTASTSAQMDDIVYAMKQDVLGKTIAVGTTYNNSSSPEHNDIAIFRVNTDGTLDTSFNSTGKSKVDFGFTDGARGVAIQPDGKILVGGFAYVSSKFRFAIMRFLSNGTLDTSYGTSGKTTTSFSSGAQALSLVLSSSGKAILGGNAFNASKNSFALARYTTNGTLDSNFGSSGKVFTTFSGSSFETILALAEDSSQNLIAVGYSTIAAVNKLALAKYASDGSLDSTFGNAGTLLPTYPGTEATATAVTLDSSNNIYVAGKSTMAGNHNLLVMKFTKNGTIDNAFGTMGAVVMDLGSAQDQGTGIAVDSLGRILVSAKGNSATLLRFLPNGQLDTSFGTNGRVDSQMGGTNAQANCLLLDSLGKILLGGTAFNSNNLDFALSRFNP